MKGNVKGFPIIHTFKSHFLKKKEFLKSLCLKNKVINIKVIYLKSKHKDIY